MRDDLLLRSLTYLFIRIRAVALILENLLLYVKWNETEVSAQCGHFPQRAVDPQVQKPPPQPRPHASVSPAEEAPQFA